MRVYEYGFVYVHVVDGIQRNHWSTGAEIRDYSGLPVIGSGNGIWVPSDLRDSPESLSHLQPRRLFKIQISLYCHVYEILTFKHQAICQVLGMCDSLPLFLSVYIVNEIFLQLTMHCSSFFLYHWLYFFRRKIGCDSCNDSIKLDFLGWKDHVF